MAWGEEEKEKGRKGKGACRKEGVGGQEGRGERLEKGRSE